MTDEQTIRQLERQLAECDSISPVDVTRKIDILNDLAWALSDTDLQRAYAHAETAYTLASSSDDGASPYQVGIAYSLRTQGYVNQRLGEYPLGMAQLLKAQGIFQSLQIDEGLPDVFDGIAGIYGQTGDFPEALELASTNSFRPPSASAIGGVLPNVYNNLAVIYHEIGESNEP